MPESLIPHPVLSPQPGSRRGCLFSLPSSQPNIEWKTDLQGHWELLFQLKNTGLCLVLLLCNSTGNLCKGRLSRGGWNFLSHRSYTFRGIGCVGLAWGLAGRCHHTEVLAPGQKMFILNLIFLGKIERTVFQDKETFLHQLVSKSQRTPDSEGTSCPVDRRGSPPFQAFFQRCRRGFTPVCSLMCS